MPRWITPPLLAITALIFVLAFAIFNATPASARVELKAGKGEAVWFYRSCTSAQGEEIASWVVGLNPSEPGQRSLEIELDNAYPGYSLNCDLYFANSGKLPFMLSDIQVHNPNPNHLELTVSVAPPDRQKILKPCSARPQWGTHPASLPAKCTSLIHLALTVGPHVAENTRLGFGVQVHLIEAPRNSYP